MIKSYGSKFFWYSVLTIQSISVLLPVLFMVNSSLRSSNDFAQNPMQLARHPYWKNFSQVWANGDFATFLKNSIFITGGSLLVTIALGVGAGFVLGKYTFKGHTIVLSYVLTGMLIPAKLMILPLFILLKDVHLLDSQIGLILVYSSGSLPAAIFILSGFFRNLPSDLDNAARIDGASEFQMLRKVLFPLVKPGIAIVAIYSAIPIWNDFFLPLVFIQSSAKKTIMQGLTIFFGEYSNQWGVLFAGLMIASIPLIALYLILSEQFIKGLTAGAIKG
jgi:raffinose/stachyose/melibiose transport system permease protein